MKTSTNIERVQLAAAPDIGLESDYADTELAPNHELLGSVDWSHSLMNLLCW
jgi:hypothetical protein